MQTNKVLSIFSRTITSSVLLLSVSASGVTFAVSGGVSASPTSTAATTPRSGGAPVAEPASPSKVKSFSYTDFTDSPSQTFNNLCQIKDGVADNPDLKNNTNKTLIAKYRARTTAQFKQRVDSLTKDLKTLQAVDTTAQYPVLTASEVKALSTTVSADLATLQAEQAAYLKADTTLNAEIETSCNIATFNVYNFVENQISFTKRAQNQTNYLTGQENLSVYLQKYLTQHGITSGPLADNLKQAGTEMKEVNDPKIVTQILAVKDSDVNAYAQIPKPAKDYFKEKFLQRFTPYNADINQARVDLGSVVLATQSTINLKSITSYNVTYANSASAVHQTTQAAVNMTNADKVTSNYAKVVLNDASNVQNTVYFKHELNPATKKLHWVIIK